MCCKPGTPLCLVRRAEGYKLSGSASLTDFSVEGNTEQTGVRQR